MSIADEILRLQTAKSDLATSIANKGVTVPANATLDDYAALVDSIQTGGGSSVTPYDAKIEYLESTGTQYIDTGINCRHQVLMSASISISKSITTNSAVFGVYYDNTTAPRFQLYIASNCTWGNPTTTYYSYYGITAKGTVNVNTLYAPTLLIKSAQQSDATIFIFARNNDAAGGASLYIDGLRLYAANIVADGVTVRDFIPVRIGTTGYLYDRVSEQLFSNSGTGNFVLGNDIT